MTDVTILGPLGNGGFDVHAKGCPDIKTGKYRGYLGQAWHLKTDSFRSLVLDIYSDFLGEIAETEDDLFEIQQSDVKAFPCTGLKVKR